MREQLKLLESLQETDLEIEDLIFKKEEAFRNSSLSKLKKELSGLKRQQDDLKSKEAKISLEHKKAMGELELLEQKIANEEKRLYSGTVTNPKELKSLNDEIASLEKLKEKQEDRFLEIALDMEEIEEAVALAEKNIRQKEKEIKEEERRLKELEEETSGKVEKLKEKAGELREKIQPNLLKIYDSRRAQLTGKVVARLNDGVCSGCNMELPAEELDKIVNNPDKLATCSNCQRILLFLEAE